MGVDAAPVSDLFPADPVETLWHRRRLPPRDVDAYYVRPRGGNTGDLLLSHGVIWYLEERGLRVWISDGSIEQSALAGDTAYLHAAIGEFPGLVCFPGGGNIGRYPDNGQVRAAVISSLHPSSRCLIFPNTYFGPEPALSDPRVVVWARDRQSLSKLVTFDVRAALVPDAAFALHAAMPRLSEGSGTYLILREDAEQVAHGVSPRCFIPDGLAGASDLTLASTIPGLVGALAPAEFVVSDRLHGGLTALMLGKKVVLLPVDYHKSRSFYDTWLTDVPAVTFARSASELPEALESLAEGCPDLTELFRSIADPLFDQLVDP